MPTPLSPRTLDLMRCLLMAVEPDKADLVTTLVASAFVDGKDAASGKQFVSADNRKESVR